MVQRPPGATRTDTRLPDTTLFRYSPVETVRTPDWRLPNGVSARAAGALVGGQPALLAMCDHLVDTALYRRMAEAGAGQGLRLGEIGREACRERVCQYV